MLVKGYIEELIPPNQARVRIPDFDGEYGYSNSVDTAELTVATVSTAFGIYPNLKIGDEVYVSFLNHRLQLPVILGRIYDASNYTDDTIAPDAHLKNLNVLSGATLPQDTVIGDITYEDLLKLKNIKDNIQSQLNDLTQPLYDQEIECGIENYDGPYDQKYHTCICKTSQNLSFLYSEDGVSYQNTPIQYKNPGRYDIYIKAILGFKSKIYKGYVNITPGNLLITIDWNVTHFIEKPGVKQTPEYTVKGILEGDDVDIKTINYYSYDINGNKTLLPSPPSSAGVYQISLDELSGADSENYIIDETTNSCTFIIDQVNTYDWGVISNTIMTYTDQSQSIKIEG